MSKIDKENLGYLGKDFQYRLIQQIIVDPKFGESIWYNSRHCKFRINCIS
jgi:hypothetical protein